jgi:hypothetical protein
VPTSGRRDGNVVEKFPGPSGLKGADTDIATTATGRSVLDARPGDPDPNELADWYKEELAQDDAGM